jgi:hypothetical protein
MAPSRREFLKTAASTGLAALPGSATLAWDQPITPERIVNLFDDLPGDKALKILAPAAATLPATTVVTGVITAAASGLIAAAARTSASVAEVTVMAADGSLAAVDCKWSLAHPRTCVAIRVGSTPAAGFAWSASEATRTASTIALGDMIAVASGSIAAAAPISRSATSATDRCAR